MNGNLTGFNAMEVESASFEVLPPGVYTAIIISSGMEVTKAGTGKFLKLELQIEDGEFHNRRVFDRLNLVNPNPIATQIARAELSSICRAVGVLTPQDSSELHGKPLRIKVSVRITEEYGEQNEVKAYLPCDKRATFPVDIPF